MPHSEIKPPVAAREAYSVASPHGSRPDPYYWMRDDERSDPAVLAHLQAENAYHQQHRASRQVLEDRLYDEIVGRLKQDDSTVPYLKHGYWYYVRFEPGQEHPIFARRPGAMDAPEQILLDGNALAVGHDYHQIGEIAVSPNGQWLAFCEDTIGRREYVLKFKNLQNGEGLPENISGVEPNLVWANDDRTVLYIEKDPETLLGLRVRKHRLGSMPAEDPLVFEQQDRTLYTGLSKSKSDRFLFIHSSGTLTSEWHTADADDPDLSFDIFLARRPEHEYDVEHLGDRFIIRTNWMAPNFRLMEVPIGDQGSQSRWRDLVAHREDTFIEEFDVFSRYLVLAVRSGGLRQLAVMPLSTAGAEPVFIAGDDAAYSMALSTNPQIETDILRYVYSSLATPSTVYDYDMRTGGKILLKRDPVLGGFDPALYETEFVFVAARDGSQIPVSLIHRRDVARDSSAPLLQYAYGSYGLSMDPHFSSPRFSLIDRGFVYAIAHVRGGQEMGRGWYDEGRLQRKMNSFTDFIDVTRALVSRGYAARDKVFAMGGSAGGLLMGAIANMSPRDYRGIVAQVPFVDPVTTMLDDSIPLTTNEYDEWGDPRSKAAYDYMLTYSPYDNVRAQAYPAMLVTTGLWDSQVQYYEPAKWVAKLRSLKVDENPLLFHIEMDAGHGGKSGRFQRYRETAMEYAFILDQLGAGAAVAPTGLESKSAAAREAVATRASMR